MALQPPNRPAEYGPATTKRRFPFRQVGQQAAADRTRREALMRMPTVEPQNGLAWGRANHRLHVGRAGAVAHPGLGLYRWVKICVSFGVSDLLQK